MPNLVREKWRNMRLQLEEELGFDQFCQHWEFGKNTPVPKPVAIGAI